VIVATAHPAKFDEVVEPLISAPVPVPAALAELLALPSVQREIAPTLEALRGVLMETTA
jgi:threonine synthase